MQKIYPLRTRYADILVGCVAIVLLIIAILVNFNAFGKVEAGSLVETAKWFDIYFFSLSCLYVTKIYLHQDVTLTHVSSFALFPVSRFGLFKLEYRNLAGNVPVLILSLAVFYIIVALNVPHGHTMLFGRIFIVFLLQYHLVNWLFLFLRNLFQPNIINVFSVFLFVQILTSMSLALDQPLFLLNPVFGWVMAPLLFEFSSQWFLVFILFALVVILGIYKMTQKYLKWI